MANTERKISRREFLRTLGFAGISAAVAEVGVLSGWPKHLEPIARAAGMPWEDGKYQTFPRSQVEGGTRVLHQIDLGTLGPDVDTIFGIDFPDDIQTGALVTHQPQGEVKETRVVGIKRTDLETVQFNAALGGDRFDVYRVSEHGGDPVLDNMARLHAQNTARAHQKVIYIGDLGLFEQQWGTNEQPLLQALVRAQRPSKAGLPEPDFVNARQY